MAPNENLPAVTVDTGKPATPGAKRRSRRERLDTPTCDATTLAGLPCPMNAVRGLTKCYAHAPEVAVERPAARRRGGLEATRTRFLPADTAIPVLSSPEAIRSVLADNVHHVRTGLLSPDRAREVTNAVRAALDLANLEISSKIAELEQLVAQRARGGA